MNTPASVQDLRELALDFTRTKQVDRSALQEILDDHGVGDGTDLTTLSDTAVIAYMHHLDESLCLAFDPLFISSLRSIQHGYLVPANIPGEGEIGFEG